MKNIFAMTIAFLSLTLAAAFGAVLDEEGPFLQIDGGWKHLRMECVGVPTPPDAQMPSSMSMRVVFSEAQKQMSFHIQTSRCEAIVKYGYERAGNRLQFGAGEIVQDCDSLRPKVKNPPATDLSGRFSPDEIPSHTLRMTFDEVTRSYPCGGGKESIVLTREEMTRPRLVNQKLF